MVSPLNTANSRPLSPHDELLESVTHYPGMGMNLSHQSRPNQMRGKILASGASSQATVALSCSFLLTASEERFARLSGKLPSSAVLVPHIHQF